jgi:cytochrome c oxidase cbb3-type subunit 3
MSDFFSSGWSIAIAVIVIASLVGCLVVLVVAARWRVMGADNTTGHVWDEDLRELNNPLPRWWMWLFVVTLVFGAVYLLLYPGLGSWAGALGWSSEAELKNDQAETDAHSAPLFAQYASLPAAKLAGDAEAMAMGERLFANHCATCHGSDARGSRGFPDLSDGDWLWGGAPERIEETIRQGRQGRMPPMAAAVGNGQDVVNVAQYVLSLSGSPHNSIEAYKGRGKFAVCAGCHGAQGQGNAALGAPNLSDSVWLHGWGEEAIVAMVKQGKLNVMPAHEGRLSDAQIHLLSAYVWSLSNRLPKPTDSH